MTVDTGRRSAGRRSLGRRAAWLVARAVGRDRAVRVRHRWLTVAVAATVMLGVAAAAIALLLLAPASGEVEVVQPNGDLPYPADGANATLAPYLQDAGTRPGVLAGAVLLAVPFLTVIVQILRFGDSAQQRRLAALSLNGATRADLRRVAVAEATPATMVGALLGGPGYLLLWVWLGVALPPGWRMLPPLRPALLGAWAAVAALVGIAVVALAARAARVGAVTPVGIVRRQVRTLSRRHVVLPVLLLAGAVVLVAWPGTWDGALRELSVLLFPVFLAGAAVTAGPPLVVALGRRRVGRRGVADRIAGRRLLADPWTPGRVTGVLLAVGLVFGVSAGGVAHLVTLDSQSLGADLLYYGAGYIMACVGALVVLGVAVVSLIGGAVEQVLDARRPTAALSALGASHTVLQSVVTLQLRTATVAPCVIGAVLGWVLTNGLVISSDMSAGSGLVALAALAAAAAMAGVLSVLVVQGAAVLIRPRVVEAASIENLRTT